MQANSINRVLVPALMLIAGLSPAATITFETDQGYVAGSIAPVNGGSTNAPFDGQQGWSRSTSNGTGAIAATTASGEYVGGLALGSGGTGTYIGGKRASVELTGYNSISFDAKYSTGIGVGFLGDADSDGLFDQTETGLAFGVGGSGVRFQVRYAGFGTEVLSGVSGTTGNWYRFNALIGESIGGSRDLTLSAYNLTTGAFVDLNGAAPGNDWSLSVTDAQFGVAPESAVGGFVRLTGSAQVDNLRFTAIPEPSTILLGGIGLLAMARRRR
jgi:hypothetical protein